METPESSRTAGKKRTRDEEADGDDEQGADETLAPESDLAFSDTMIALRMMHAQFPKVDKVAMKPFVLRSQLYSSVKDRTQVDRDLEQILVVANPTNTNALILKEFAPSIPLKNVTCLTRLDHNRALGQISERLSVHVSDVKNVIIWGNHSSSQYPDVNHATVTSHSGEKSVRGLIRDNQWLNGEFITIVQQRAAAIIVARKLSSVLSAASAACDRIHDWVLGTPKGTWVSMGVYSDGSYGIPAGLVYSFHVTCEKGEWSIVQGLPIDEFSRKNMDATAKELTEEKSLSYSCL